MKKIKRKIIVAVIFCIIAVCIIYIFMMLKNRNNNANDEVKSTEEWDNQYSEIDKNTVNYENTDDVDKIKEQMGLTASSDMYEITEEYDGRKTLNIKPTILYRTAFAGIVKQEKPQFDEIDKIFQEKYPNGSGIWISERSREKFLKILEKSTRSKYDINQNGYLEIINKLEQNEQDKKLEEIIKSNKKTIIDINDFDYDIDNVSGEIVEYPFCQLGDLLDVVENGNDKIIVIAESKVNMEDNKEIIEELINSI